MNSVCAISYVTGLADLYHGKVFWVRFQEQALGRNVVTIRFELFYPSAAMDAPTVLSFIDEFIELIHQTAFLSGIFSES